MTRLFGKDYGKPAATRLLTEDYEYLWEVAFARKKSMSEILRETIHNQVAEMKEIEAKLKTQKENPLLKD